MKGFKDLEFTDRGLLHAVMEFDNGYGVIVIQGAGSYTNEEKLYELAIKKNGLLCYSSGITDDVLGYLDESQVTEYMKQVQQLDNEPELLEEDESFSRDICDHDYPVGFVEGERVLAETRDKKREEKIYLCTVPGKAFSKHIVLDPDYIEEYKNGENYHWAYYDDIKKLPKTLDGTTKTIDGNEYLLSLIIK